MTEGLFAVLGALVGAAGAWIAALIAGRASRYQADKQASAAHEQWLRQVRRDLYAEFLGKAREAERAASNAYVAVRKSEQGQLIPEDQFNELHLDCTRNSDELSKLAHSMMLEAPKSLSDSVENFAGLYHLFSLVLEAKATNATAQDLALSPRLLDIGGTENLGIKITQGYYAIAEKCRASIQGA